MTTELDIREDVVERTPALFAATTPEDVVQKATEAAVALSRVIEDRQLYNRIGPRKHVNVEGWTLLGSMLGVFPVVEWSRAITDIEGTVTGYEARVSVRNMHGQEIGSAEAMCTRQEKTWKNRDDYALRSMAQTRAVSKAMRHPLGFVMTLAGYDPTPEAEVPQEQAPAQPTGTPLTAETVAALTASLTRAEFFDPTRWTLESVLRTATRAFGRPIEKIADLTEQEAQRILEGARAAIAQGEAEYTAATDVEGEALFGDEEVINEH